MNKAANMLAKKRFFSRLKLLLIILLFAGPLAAALLSYYGNPCWGLNFSHVKQTNYAPLINPAVSLQAFTNPAFTASATSATSSKMAKPVTLQDLTQKWSIIHVLREPCDRQCQRALYNSRQTRLAVGKDIKRIKRYIIINNAISENGVGENAISENGISENAAAEVKPNPPYVDQIHANHPDALLLKASPTGLEHQLKAVLGDKIDNNTAVLVDPNGNMMMMIPVDMPPRHWLKDLKKLLRLSHIG